MLEMINVEKFRNLQNFKLESLQRINIITGPNNIGKTSLLEAISFATIKDVDSVVLYLFQILNKRDPEKLIRTKMNFHESFIKMIEDYYNFFSVESNTTKIEFKKSSSLDYLFEVKVGNKAKKYIQLADLRLFKLNTDNFVFLVEQSGSIVKLKDWYKSVQENEDEEFINEQIKSFDKNIENFKIIGDEPMVKIKTLDKYLPISELGDGLKRYIFMLIAFYKVKKGGTIFIDEIENGIWYKNYSLVWKCIIELSKKFDVQLFTTTHSKEMIEAFVKASSETDFNEYSLIEMIDEGKKYVYFDSKTLRLELENEFEVRG